jgi:hypothetical protein
MLSGEARGLLFGVVFYVPPPLLSLRSSLSNFKLRPPPERRLTAFPRLAFYSVLCLVLRLQNKARTTFLVRVYNVK